MLEGACSPLFLRQLGNRRAASSIFRTPKGKLRNERNIYCGINDLRNPDLPFGWLCLVAARGCNRQTPALRSSPGQTTLSRDGPVGASAATAQGGKPCRLRSTSIWEEGDSLFTKQSQELLCFQLCTLQKAIKSETFFKLGGEAKRWNHENSQRLRRF